MLLQIILIIPLIEYQNRLKMKSYLTFDQFLSQDLKLSGELSEVIPRHDSIFFVETSGKSPLFITNMQGVPFKIVSLSLNHYIHNFK